MANSLFGYACIFSLMFAGLSAEVSNALGYTIGVFVSYLSHKFWTFKSDQGHKKEFAKFVAVVLTAYGLNLLILVICVRLLNINPYLSQLISGSVYVIASFFFLKYFAFKLDTKN